MLSSFVSMVSGHFFGRASETVQAAPDGPESGGCGLGKWIVRDGYDHKPFFVRVNIFY
jgi:hypothetical protein